MSGIDDPDEEEGTLVEEGVFQVDRARALDKLMRYQLPDPAMFVLLLVRCAAASGATKISFDSKRSGSGVVVRFNGDPFTDAILRQPYSSLFRRANKKIRRDRQLAISILSILRLNPGWITVRSGSGKNRVKLYVNSIKEESIEPARDGETGTILTAAGVSLNKTHEELLRSRCRLSPIPIVLRGKQIPRDLLTDRHVGRYTFDEDGVRGWFEIPEKPGSHSILRASRYGVFVSNVRHRLPVGQVVGSFNADSLSVSASQFGLLRNARFKKTVAVIGRNVEAFALQELSRLDYAIPQLRETLMEPIVRRRWSTLLSVSTGGAEDRGLLSWFGDVVNAIPIAPEIETFLSVNARRIAWLRQTARRVCLGESGKGKNVLRERLWKAPLFFGTDGISISLQELDSQRHRIGYIPTTKTCFPELKTAFRALWFATPGEDEFLERFFPMGTMDVTPLLMQEKTYGGFKRSRGAPKLERLGLASLLTRLPINHGGVAGEVALPFHRFPSGARVHSFDLGRPHQYKDVAGHLRYAAALEGGADLPKLLVPEAETGIPSLLKDKCLSLYRRAAEEYEIKQQGEPRQDALRAHLLDFLVWAVERGSAMLKEQAWIVQVPLFKQQGRAFWTYHRLHKAYKDGETLFFAPSGNKARAFPGSMLFVGSELTEGVLAILFKGCVLKHFPGRDAVLMLYEPMKHQGAVAAVSIGGNRFEAAPGYGKGGLAVEAGFGPFRIFGESSSLRAVDASVGARIISGLLREMGSMGREPENPQRQWLLKAVGKLYSPWPGRSFESEELRHGMELLVEFPFFRRPEGNPWTIAELHARFGRNRKLDPNEIVLDAAEEALIRQFWPKDSSRLLKKPHKQKKKSSKKIPKDEKPPEASKEPAVLSFSTPMIYERELESQGIRALVGLPPELLPGLSIIVRRDGKLHRYSLRPEGLSAAATLFIDADGWGGKIEGQDGKLHAAFQKITLGIYNRFLYGLLDMLPNADAESFGYDSLLLYLMFHLRGDDRAARKSGPEWSPLRQRVRSSLIVPLLGGQRASIDQLEARAKKAGALIYVDDRAVDRGEDSADVPIFRHPRLAAQVLGGISLKRYKRIPKTAERIKLDEELLSSVSPEQRLENRFCSIFQELNGRRGLDFEEFPKIESFELIDSRSSNITPGLSCGRLRVNKGHPLVAKVLYAKIPPEAKAEFLASLIYTEVNRKEKTLTDLEDSRFQRSLADDVNKRGA